MTRSDEIIPEVNDLSVGFDTDDGLVKVVEDVSFCLQ